MWWTNSITGWSKVLLLILMSGTLAWAEPVGNRVEVSGLVPLGQANPALPDLWEALEIQPVWVVTDWDRRVWNGVAWAIVGAGVVGLAWASGLLVLFVLGKFLSYLTLRFLDRNDPVREPPAWQRGLRGIYRALIWVAGLYYYASVLVLIGLALAIPGSILLGIALMPEVHGGVVWLALPLSVLVFTLVVPLVRSLRSKRIDQAPGRSLLVDEAAGLWALTREVAEQVGTRPVDEIRLLSGTQLGVRERGRPRDRSRDRSRRTLLLGLGAFDGLSIFGFRAGLAHEYGHFLHRDTAGGDIALRVLLMLEQLGQDFLDRGQARWWNVGWHFVRLYHFLFRRLTFGASRLQEIRADLVAARCTGPEACRVGLREKITRDVEYAWERITAFRSHLYGQSYQPAPPLRSPEGLKRRAIEGQVAEIFDLKTNDDDTHPCPAQRQRLYDRVQAFGVEASVVNPDDRHRRLWDLFDDLDRIRAEYRRRFDTDVQNELDMHAAHFDYFVALYTASIHDQPQDPTHLFHRAETLAELGDDQGALADYDQALQLGGPNPFCHYQRGLTRSRLGDIEGALDDFHAAIHIAPTSFEPGTRVELGDLHARQGNFERAVNEYGKALDLLGESADLLIRRGNARLELGATRTAIDDFTKALELDPLLTEALVARAAAHEAEGDNAKALNDAKRAVAQDPRFQSAHHLLDRLLASLDGQPRPELKDESREPA